MTTINKCGECNKSKTSCECMDFKKLTQCGFDSVHKSLQNVATVFIGVLVLLGSMQAMGHVLVTTPSGNTVHSSVATVFTQAANISKNFTSIVSGGFASIGGEGQLAKTETFFSLFDDVGTDDGGEKAVSKITTNNIDCSYSKGGSNICNTNNTLKKTTLKSISVKINCYGDFLDDRGKKEKTGSIDLNLIVVSGAEINNVFPGLPGLFDIHGFGLDKEKNEYRNVLTRFNISCDKSTKDIKAYDLEIRTKLTMPLVNGLSQRDISQGLLNKLQCKQNILSIIELQDQVPKGVVYTSIDTSKVESNSLFKSEFEGTFKLDTVYKKYIAFCGKPEKKSDKKALADIAALHDPKDYNGCSEKDWDEENLTCNNDVKKQDTATLPKQAETKRGCEALNKEGRDEWYKWESGTCVTKKDCEYGWSYVSGTCHILPPKETPRHTIEKITKSQCLTDGNTIWHAAAKDGSNCWRCPSGSAPNLTGTGCLSVLQQSENTPKAAPNKANRYIPQAGTAGLPCAQRDGATQILNGVCHTEKGTFPLTPAEAAKWKAQQKTSSTAPAPVKKALPPNTFPFTPTKTAPNCPSGSNAVAKNPKGVLLCKISTNNPNKSTAADQWRQRYEQEKQRSAQVAQQYRSAQQKAQQKAQTQRAVQQALAKQKAQQAKSKQNSANKQRAAQAKAAADKKRAEEKGLMERMWAYITGQNKQPEFGSTNGLACKSFTASDTDITAGESIRLQWEVSGAAKIVITPKVTITKDDNGKTIAIATPTSSVIGRATDQKDIGYTLIATDTAGKSIRCYTEPIGVKSNEEELLACKGKAGSVEISADPTTVTRGACDPEQGQEACDNAWSGEEVTIEWQAQCVDSCALEGPDGLAKSGLDYQDSITGTLYKTSEFIIECEDKLGNLVDDEVTIEVEEE